MGTGTNFFIAESCTENMPENHDVISTRIADNVQEMQVSNTTVSYCL